MAGVTGVEGVERERVREKGVVVRSGCDDEFSQLSVVSQLSVELLQHSRAGLDLNRSCLPCGAKRNCRSS